MKDNVHVVIEIKFIYIYNMKVAIIHGANLNLLGYREPDIYGNHSFEESLNRLRNTFPEVEIHYHQSNIEGEIINFLHEMDLSCDAIILNPGGYTHTSVAIADAIAAIRTPVLEVHISNIYQRESYRHISITGSKCVGVISGLGMKGYELAIHYFLPHHGE